MTTQQLAILNALVTYAAEHIPGGLSENEQAVAQMVGNWALGMTGTKEYDYKIINPTHYPSTEAALNGWSERGWRVVSAIPGHISGRTSPKITYGIILERPVRVSHPDD